MSNLQAFEDALASVASERMMAQVAKMKPQARIEGVTVPPMLGPSVELIVGVSRDPV
jgi:acyl-CoA synthetase (NDP forming)